MMPIRNANDGSEPSEMNPNSEPERSENTERSARLPDAEQAEATEYAYDPQTYEILCRPGQRLTLKKAQRLQELGLYAQVVRPVE